MKSLVSNFPSLLAFIVLPFSEEKIYPKRRRNERDLPLKGIANSDLVDTDLDDWDDMSRAVSSKRSSSNDRPIFPLFSII